MFFEAIPRLYQRLIVAIRSVFEIKISWPKANCVSIFMDKEATCFNERFTLVHLLAEFISNISPENKNSLRVEIMFHLI